MLFQLKYLVKWLLVMKLNPVPNEFAPLALLLAVFCMISLESEFGGKARLLSSRDEKDKMRIHRIQNLQVWKMHSAPICKTYIWEQTWATSVSEDKALRKTANQGREWAVIIRLFAQTFPWFVVREQRPNVWSQRNPRSKCLSRSLDKRNVSKRSMRVTSGSHRQLNASKFLKFLFPQVPPAWFRKKKKTNKRQNNI